MNNLLPYSTYSQELYRAADLMRAGIVWTRLSRYHTNISGPFLGAINRTITAQEKLDNDLELLRNRQKRRFFDPDNHSIHENWPSIDKYTTYYCLGQSMECISRSQCYLLRILEQISKSHKDRDSLKNISNNMENMVARIDNILQTYSH